MTASHNGAPAPTKFSPSPDQTSVRHLKLTVRSFARISKSTVQMFVICGGVGFPIQIEGEEVRDFDIGESLIAEFPKGSNPLNTPFSAIYPASMKPQPQKEKPMTEIIVAGDGQAVTMTSLEMVDFINSQRGDDEARLAHSDFLKKVPLVLGDEVAGKFSCYYKASNGKQNPMYRFQKREACLMAMSYSYDLQAAVFDKMTALEQQLANQQPAAPAIPQTLPEALRLAADLAEQKQVAEAERDEAVRTKALIGSKREATAMAAASAAKREAAKLRDQLGRNSRHATITAVEQVTGQKFPRNAYVPMRRWCKERGVNPAEVFDERYGMVKAWPAGAWLEIHNIDLRSLFGEMPKRNAATHLSHSVA